MSEVCQVIGNLASWTASDGTCFMPLANPRLIARRDLPYHIDDSFDGQTTLTGILWSYAEDGGAKLHCHLVTPQVEFVVEQFQRYFDDVRVVRPPVADSNHLGVPRSSLRKSSKKMLLSIHIPKTAGRSFQHYLQKVFSGRLLADYGDWVEIKTEEGIHRNERRRAEALFRAKHIQQHFDAIHGHYSASKYKGIFTDAEVVAFVRDPYQHAISTYEHASRSDIENHPHPGIRLFREDRMTVVDLIEAFPNHQSLYLSSMPLNDFAMVGLTDAYDRSLALFRALFWSCGFA